MPVYPDPTDGLAVPVGLLQAWTARLVDPRRSASSLAIGRVLATTALERLDGR